MRFLLSSGALINAIDKDSNTALHYAIIKEKPEIIEYLLSSYPDLEIKNNEGLSIFDLFKQKGIDYIYNPSITLTISDYDEPEKEANISKNDASSKPTRIATLQDFEIIQIIGRGSFGEVFLVRNKLTNELLAMKVLKKEKVFAQNLVRYVMTERNVLSYIKHPFIVSLKYAFQDNYKLFLMLQYCPGGNLSSYIHRYGRLTEEIARIYLCEIILAIAELHKRDIIYRDLKPDNVVIDENGHALLTDFGLSKEGVFDNVSANSFCGSIAYLPPEMIKRQGHGKAVD